MKNEHLVPVNVVDIVNRLKDPSIRENEKINYILRLEAIREYCAVALSKNNTASISFVDARRKK